MKFLALITVVAALSGCFGKREVVVTKEVKVPVAVPCVSEGNIPEKPERPAGIREEDNIFVKAKAVSVYALVLEKDNNTLRAILQECVISGD